MMEDQSAGEDPGDFIDDFLIKIETDEEISAGGNQVNTSQKCDQQNSSNIKFENGNLPIFKKEIDRNVENNDEEFYYSNTNFSVFTAIKEEYPLDIIDEKVFDNSIDANEVNNVYEQVKTENEFHKSNKKFNDENSIKHDNEIQIGSKRKRRNQSGLNPPSKKSLLTTSIESISETRYPCKYCKKTYKHKFHANHHMKSNCWEARAQQGDWDKKPVRYHCELCETNFTAKYSLARHRFFLHSVGHFKKPSCGICLKLFSTRDTLNRHLRSKKCGGGPVNEFTCSICNRRYRDMSSLRRHVNNECDKEPRFGCAHCDYLTLQKGNLVRHLARMHGTQLDLFKAKCPKCSKVYKNECTLKRHLQFECDKEPSFACNFCSYKTKRKFCLTSHVKNWHAKSKS